MRRVLPIIICLTGLLYPAYADAKITQLAQPQMVLHAIDSPAKSRPRMVRTIWDTTPWTGRQTSLPVLGTRKYAGQSWVHLILMGRPNGLRGWVKAEQVKLITNHWGIRVDISNRILVARKNGKIVKRLKVVVGAPSTPTPQGHFYIEDRTRITQTWEQNGWALSTSAFSDILHHFDGGDGQIAIHTRGSLTDAMGTAASHGCVRVPAAVAGWLARWIPPGTPLDIVR